MAVHKRLALLLQKEATAFGAGILHRLIPRGEVALGISFAAIEERVILSVLGYYFCRALGARNTGILGYLLRELTLGEVFASIE